MLAEIYRTRIFDIRSNFVPQSQYQTYSVNKKLEMVLKNRVEKTFFIYEPVQFFYYWDLILSKSSNNKYSSASKLVTLPVTNGTVENRTIFRFR